jgi:hypothetical protein
VIDPVLAARARGLASRHPLAVPATPRGAEQAIRVRITAELRLLARWAEAPRCLAPIFLDEDRHTLRAIARGLVANAVPASRSVGAITTPTLSQRTIEAIAGARSFAEIGERLADHPLATAFAASDLFTVEHALVRCYFERARTADAAVATYLAQLADVENASTALLLSQRGGELAAGDLFLRGGRVLARDAFLAGCRDRDRTVLARAFARTPLASAVFSSSPSAFEDAALAWQIAAQARLRRIEPLGLANVLWYVLDRRDEARHLRRAAWTLGGAA